MQLQLYLYLKDSLCIYKTYYVDNILSTYHSYYIYIVRIYLYIIYLYCKCYILSIPTYQSVMFGDC